MREHDKHHLFCVFAVMSILHFDIYPANFKQIETYRNLKETTFILMTSMGFLIHMKNLRPGLLFELKSRDRKLYRRPLLRAVVCINRPEVCNIENLILFQFALIYANINYHPQRVGFGEIFPEMMICHRKNRTLSTFCETFIYL